MHVLLRFDPGHELIAAEARVTAHDDRDVFAKAFTNRRDDLLQGCQRAVAAIAVRRAQLRPQRDVATEAIERQVAVAAVVTMEEAALLLAVQGIIGGVKIQHDDLAKARNGRHALTQ
jgi:hypothetical protein